MPRHAPSFSARPSGSAPARLRRGPGSLPASGRALFLMALLALLPVLMACGRSAPTHFYSLAGEPGGAASAPAGPCVSLGVGPVDMPTYLDRTKIVTRGEGSAMNLAEFDQWIEPVADNFTRALTDDLAALVCARPIVPYPWPNGARPDYQISVVVRQFDGTLGKEAVLRADWSITGRDGRMVGWKSSSLREASAGAGYDALVSAQKRLVEKLAVDMAEALEARPK